MSFRPKIMIQKRIILDAKGHFRFYPPTYSRDNPKYIPPSVVISLDPRDQYNSKGQLYPKANIQTEKQLVTMIYNNWGAGDYFIVGFLKGREGLFTFWRGEILDSGWCFQVKNYIDNDIKRIQNEILKSKDEDEKLDLERDLDFFKEMNKEDNKAKRYGFYPFLKSSGRRGEWHSWEEPDFEDTKFKELNKIPKKLNSDKEMSLDEINNF